MVKDTTSMSKFSKFQWTFKICNFQMFSQIDVYPHFGMVVKHDFFEGECRI